MPPGRPSPAFLLVLGRRGSVAKLGRFNLAGARAWQTYPERFVRPHWGLKSMLSTCIGGLSTQRIEQRFPFRCSLKVKEASHRLHSVVYGSLRFPSVPARFPPLYECLAQARQQAVEIHKTRFRRLPPRFLLKVKEASHQMRIRGYTR